jgi:glutaredoxin
LAERPILYTLSNCPTCVKAKRDLKREGVDYEERQVDSNPTWYDEALNYAATVPIYVEGESVTIGWKGEHG